MSKGEPFLLDEHLEPSQGAVVGIQHKHRERGQLRGAVPTVRAVDQDRGLVVLHLGKGAYSQDPALRVRSRGDKIR